MCFVMFCAGCSNFETQSSDVILNDFVNVSLMDEESYVDCNITRLEKIVSGHSMEPLVEDGQSVVLLEGYYECNVVKKGDFVAYDYAGNDNSIIKVVKVTDEDFVEISGRHLIVNGKILKNSVNESYEFSQKELKMLGLYSQQ